MTAVNSSWVCGEMLDPLPFLELIFDCKRIYTTAITTFEKIYSPRILSRT